MYEYKVVQAKNYKHAEEVMNQMASEGWRVVSTTFWTNLVVSIIITFEREKA